MGKYILPNITISQGAACFWPLGAGVRAGAAWKNIPGARAGATLEKKSGAGAGAA